MVSLLSGRYSYSLLRRRKRAVQAKLRSTTPRRGNSTKPPIGLRQLHDFELQAVDGRILGRSVAHVPLVDKLHLDRVACDLLHLPRQLFHLRAILRIG
jgi:hypothetical protein